MLQYGSSTCIVALQLQYTGDSCSGNLYIKTVRLECSCGYMTNEIGCRMLQAAAYLLAVRRPWQRRWRRQPATASTGAPDAHQAMPHPDVVPELQPRGQVTRAASCADASSLHTESQLACTVHRPWCISSFSTHFTARIGLYLIYLSQ